MNKMFDKVDEMLENPTRLIGSQLEWVKKIDKTAAGFKAMDFTPRQSEVLDDIYNKFKRRQKGIDREM